MRPPNRSSVATLLFVGVVLCGTAAAARGADGDAVGGGELLVRAADGSVAGACPLKRTDVKADVAGMFARVTVRQVFHNPSEEKIEAVYVFPLPEHAAVDDMTLTAGGRRVVATIKRREEARELYDRARAAGHVAGLLDQERPNIFTQSVANIEPGAEIAVEIA